MGLNHHWVQWQALGKSRQRTSGNLLGKDRSLTGGNDWCSLLSYRIAPMSGCGDCKPDRSGDLQKTASRES